MVREMREQREREQHERQASSRPAEVQQLIARLMQEALKLSDVVPVEELDAMSKACMAVYQRLSDDT